MKVIYISDDGKQFDNEWDCEFHEQKLNHPNLKNVSWILEDGTTRGVGDCFENFVYDHCIRIIVPTKEAAADVRWLADYCGFCAYNDIIDMGVWDYCIDTDGNDNRFVKVEEV